MINTVVAVDTNVHIQEDTLDTNYTGNSVLHVWGGIEGALRNSLLSFDLSGVSLNQISYAVLELYVTSNSPGEGPFQANRMTQRGWVQAQATWRDYATDTPWTTPGGDFTEDISELFYGLSSGETQQIVLPPAIVLADFKAAGETHWLLSSLAEESATFGFRSSTLGPNYEPKLVLGYWGDDAPGYPGRYGRQAGRKPYVAGETMGGQSMGLPGRGRRR